MIPKFRAWHKELNMMFEVKSLVYTLRLATLVNKNDLVPIRICTFDDIILMQSTGLFDKNKNEVFVGDEIRCTSGCPHEVYIEKEYGGTFIGGMPTIYLKGIDQGYAWTGDEEILGNIYELESVEE